MTMREKIARAICAHIDLIGSDDGWRGCLDVADAVLDAISNIDDVDFDAFYLGFKHHRGSVKDSIRAGLRAMIDAAKGGMP